MLGECLTDRLRHGYFVGVWGFVVGADGESSVSTHAEQAEKLLSLSG